MVLYPLRVFLALGITSSIICVRKAATESLFPIQPEASASRINVRAPNCWPPSSGCRQPIQHVYYLKIHKAGSSTLFAIMAEYCRSHQLLALLPIMEHINQQTPLRPQQELMLHPSVKHYDMVFNHHVYDPAIFNYLHNDTFKFTMLREPFKHFVSSFTYFKDSMEYLHCMGRYRDPITAFLRNPMAFEAKGFKSYTNNRQSVDLGYDIRKHSFSNDSYISHFIKQTEERFDLILITDFFMESIVLLKRALNWDTEDIVYYVKNVHPESKTVLANMTEWHRERHRTFSQPDIKLYQHFLSLFKFKMTQTIGLQEEIFELNVILRKVRSFCNRELDRSTGKFKRNVSLARLEIPAGQWSDRVSLSKSKCKWLRVDELIVTDNLKVAQNFMLRKWKIAQKFARHKTNKTITTGLL